MSVNVLFQKGLIVGLVSFFWICSSALAIAQEKPVAGSAIVLFDQSGSMGRFDPLAISKIWLLTFIKTFTDPRQVRLVGFDEDVHAPIILETGPDTDLATITGTIEKIKTKGKATDLESPFRYLSALKDIEDVDLILIISDGEPEVWDTSLGYLSVFVQNDPRYVDINDLYTQFAQNKENDSYHKQILEQIYLERNIEIIESRIASLPAEIGAKTVIWDISGRSAYLKKWAALLKSEYLGARIVSQEDPVGQLKSALEKLQAQASLLISKPLPEDHEARIETVLSTVEEVQQEISEGIEKQAAEPAPVAEPEPESVVESAPVSPPAPAGTVFLPLSGASETTAAGLFVIGLLLLLCGSIYWLFMRGKRKELASVPMEILSNPLADSEPERDGARGERRFAVRVPVPEGAMSVHWTNANGKVEQGNVINVSLHGLFFAAADFTAQGIERLEYPSHDIRLEITQSRIVRQVDGKVAVVIEKFHNNIDNWMKWVALLTRINEEK